MAIRFGSSGCGIEFAEEDNSFLLFVPDFIKRKGLNAFEYSFGHGYRMHEETAREVGLLFRKYDIKVSIHAPYYINFANPDEEMYHKSEGYLRTGIKFLRAFGYADHLVFHSGSCGKEDRQICLDRIKYRFDKTFDKFEKEGLFKDIWLCPETMGKPLQIGSYKEVVDFCLIHPKVVPTFDFGHINALTQGSLKGKDDYKRIIDYSIEKLGKEKMDNCHIHFSKIQYGEKGEIRHLNFEDDIYGPDYEPLMEILADYKLGARVISESAGMQPRDAKIMKDYFEKYSNSLK